MSKSVSFADVVNQSIVFSTDVPAHALLLKLVDTRWFQRLRDISQTANTRLLYMFSEHSRFGHCLGTAYLANQLLDSLEGQHAPLVGRYRSAICAAALLHDLGHLAPGSHTAFKSWFPEQKDDHEEVAVRIISQDPELQEILRACGPDFAAQVCSILREDEALPPWTWEIISGGGWNVDRGNWCIVDSILAGVRYGQYNIPAITGSIVISADGHLTLLENRVDAMVHFAVSRHAMYRQIYQHRVLLAADALNAAIVRRARDLLAEDNLDFADEHMLAALRASCSAELPLKSVFWMRESWWRYHLLRWIEGPDRILADLSDRLLNRRLFKTVRITGNDQPAELAAAAEKAVRDSGFDPRYYLHRITTADMHEGDYRRSMPVKMDDGRTLPLTEAEPLINALLGESRQNRNSWFAMPTDAKLKLGRRR